MSVITRCLRLKNEKFLSPTYILFLKLFACTDYLHRHCHLHLCTVVWTRSKGLIHSNPYTFISSWLCLVCYSIWDVFPSMLPVEILSLKTQISVTFLDLLELISKDKGLWTLGKEAVVNRNLHGLLIKKSFCTNLIFFLALWLFC
jgi:hypothetical protein